MRLAVVVGSAIGAGSVLDQGPSTPRRKTDAAAPSLFGFGLGAISTATLVVAVAGDVSLECVSIDSPFVRVPGDQDGLKVA